MSTLRRTRWSGWAGALLLASALGGVAGAPGSAWPEAAGAFSHLALLPLATALSAPNSARASGFAWLTIDVTVSIALLNGAPLSTVFPLRLGGHVLAATWIAAVAVGQVGARRWLGWAAALPLGAYSFLAHVLGGPPVLLMLAGPLLITWLALSAAALGRDPPADESSPPAPSHQRGQPS